MQSGELAIEGLASNYESRPRVGVVVLNWNGWQDTLECLDSLLHVEWPGTEVVVVDNGSTDDSVARICSWATERGIDIQILGTRAAADRHGTELCAQKDDATGGTTLSTTRFVLITNDENAGFARGNNLGIRRALGDGAEYICLLNNDTIVPSDFVERAVAALRSGGAALVGPKILDAAGRDWQWPVKARLGPVGWLLVFSVLRRVVKWSALYKRYFYSGDKPAYVYAIPGSCMFFDARALREIDLLDEATFLFWEEFIVAERLLAHGYRTLYDPRIRIAHKWNRSVDKIGPRKFLANWESEIYFFSQYRRCGIGVLIVQKVVRFCALLGRFLLDPQYRRADVLREAWRVLVWKWS